MKRKKKKKAKSLPKAGIEPATLRTSVSRSSNWAISAYKTLLEHILFHSGPKTPIFYKNITQSFEKSYQIVWRENSISYFPFFEQKFLIVENKFFFITFLSTSKISKDFSPVDSLISSNSELQLPTRKIKNRHAKSCRKPGSNQRP